MADFVNTLCEDPGSLVASGAAPIRGTQQKSLAVSITEPDGMDYTRAGKRFFLGRNAAATGIAPVQTQMTTAAQWVIWNTSSTLTMFFDMIGVILDSGVGGATGTTLYVAHFSAPAQTGFATGISAVSANGNSTATSSAAVKSGITITAPAAPTWFPIANVPSAVTPGILGTTVANYEVRGKIAVQPLRGLGFAVAGAAGTTPLFGPVAEWVEVVSTCS